VRDEKETSVAKDFLLERQRAYQKLFGNKSDPAVKLVLQDLARFCRKSASCFSENPRLHSLFEGRREVCLRIDEHVDLSFEDLWEIYS
jgi:hypothetical protein